MRAKKTKHRPTNEELEIFAELERMAKHAQKHERGFRMSSLNSKPKPIHKKENRMTYQEAMDHRIAEEQDRLPRGTPRHVAVLNACQKHPELRAAAVKEANNQQVGVQPVGTGSGSLSGSGCGSAEAEMENLINAEVERTGKPRHECVLAVCQANPALREQAVIEHNSNLQNRVRPMPSQAVNRPYGRR